MVYVRLFTGSLLACSGFSLMGIYTTGSDSWAAGGRDGLIFFSLFGGELSDGLVSFVGLFFGELGAEDLEDTV